MRTSILSNRHRSYWVLAMGRPTTAYRRTRMKLPGVGPLALLITVGRLWFRFVVPVSRLWQSQLLASRVVHRLVTLRTFLPK